VSIHDTVTRKIRAKQNKHEQAKKLGIGDSFKNKVFRELVSGELLFDEEETREARKEVDGVYGEMMIRVRKALTDIPGTELLHAALVPIENDQFIVLLIKKTW